MIYFFILIHQETHFRCSHILNPDCREVVLRSASHAGTSIRTRLLFTIPPAVAPTNKSALAVARMEIFKTKDLNEKGIFYCCDRVEAPSWGLVHV